MYADKFKAANNLDDILLSTTNYINEDLNHERKDSIKEFARGDVLIRVGNNDYSAKAIIGFTSGQNMVLYDIIDFVKDSFEMKKKTSQSAMHNAGSQRNEISSNSIIPNSPETVKENFDESESDTQKSIPSENVRHNQERYLKWLYKKWGLTKYSEDNLKADIKDLRHAVALYKKGGQYREEARGIIERLSEKALTDYERIQITDEAKEIRRALRSYTFKLTDKQKQEAEYVYGSVTKFAKAYIFYQRQKRWISSISKELYIIGEKHCISSSRRKIHGGAVMIYAPYSAMICTPYGVMIYQACGLDKKRTAEAVLFWHPRPESNR